MITQKERRASLWPLIVFTFQHWFWNLLRLSVWFAMPNQMRQFPILRWLKVKLKVPTIEPHNSINVGICVDRISPRSNYATDYMGVWTFKYPALNKVLGIQVISVQFKSRTSSIATRKNWARILCILSKQKYSPLLIAMKNPALNEVLGILIISIQFKSRTSSLATRKNWARILCL